MLKYNKPTLLQIGLISGLVKYKKTELEMPMKSGSKTQKQKEVK